ncbi:RodZ domain-containing protein [Peptococcaceae bacterium 1198_IL3148]
MEIGDLLKQTRLTKGYSLDDIEEATKIRSRYLEALENEKFDLLPGQVYVIAFLRNYARFLGLNDDELVEQYKSKFQSNINIAAKETEENKPTVKERPSRRRRRRGQSQIAKLVAAVAVIAVIFAFASVYKAYAPGHNVPELPNAVQDNDDNDQPKDNNGDVNNTPPENNQSEPPEQPIEGVELVLNVTDANCWMRVDVDGQIAFEGTVTAGTSKEFSGSESINIILGNAGVVDVQYNGENLGKLGPMGQVVNEQFKAQQG